MPPKMAAADELPNRLSEMTGVVQNGAPQGATRHWLSDGAWVDVQRGWLNGCDELFLHLHQTLTWRPEYQDAVDTPRLYRGPGRDLTEGPPQHPRIKDMCDRLNRTYVAELSKPFATAGLCLYRDGNDSVAWHGDKGWRDRHVDTMVATVSLGATRTFSLRALSGAGTLDLSLHQGDLLVMGGSCQWTWEHCVPKAVGRCGPRISIQFRPR